MKGNEENVSLIDGKKMISKTEITRTAVDVRGTREKEGQVVAQQKGRPLLDRQN